MKLVLGIDPGSVTTGYGIVGESGGALHCVAYGVFEGNAKESLAKRLLIIGRGLEEIITQHEIAAVSLEKTFFAKNADSAAKLGQARGVLLYECAKAGLPVFEYNPTEVKASIVGNGRAEKEQVQFVIRTLLNLPAMGKFDMSDALALAVHHVRIATTQAKMREMELNK
jgi:crossover junction endodeoxyribonuclease RuvC